MGQMDMNESPHVVLVVVGEYADRVPVSAHEDERSAAHWIGDEALAGRLPAGPIELERIAAPFLAQRTADARSIARQERPLDRGPYVLADLRDILADAQHDRAAVHRMPPSALLDLVRSLIDAANTPARADEARERLEALIGDDPERVQLDAERVDAAVRAHWTAHRVTTAWENAPGPDQEREVRAVERIVAAYLADPED